MRNSSVLALLTCLLMLSYGSEIRAQAPFTVTRLSDFMDGYPMVTKILFDYIQPYEVSGLKDKEPVFRVADLILEVNGTDAKSDNAMNAFFTDSVISLKLLRWPDMEFNFKFRNLLYNPENETGDLFSCKAIPVYKTSLPGMRVVKAKDEDFSKYKTYDFLIEGDDPLVDEEILDTFIKGGLLSERMKRDKENPDVVFRLARSADESISSTYVPPTTETINTGSTTNPVYNYITRTTSYVTKQRYRKVEHEGHTEITNLSKLYFEIVALDASKLNDPNQKTAPEIWELIYSDQKVNDNRPLIDRYKEIASLGGYPFKGDDINLTLDISCGARMMPSVDNKSLVVLGVAPMSPAARLGLQPMDIILKINGKNSFKRKDMSNKGYSLLEKDVTLGALAEEIANVAYIMTHAGLTKGYPPFLKSMGFSILEKSENEFLIERNGKKIKLKGNLWDPSLYNVKPESFLKTARYIANPVFHEYIRMQFK